MLLKDKVAVIYGGGGAIGGAVARAFGAEGATVFVTGPNATSIGPVADDILGSGGCADAAVVDALDEAAIDAHLAGVVERAGRVDVSFNAVGIPDAGLIGTPLVDLDASRFALPITDYARTYFLTARLAARRMIPHRSGVIMTVSALPSRTGTRLNGGYGAAQAAKDALTRDLSAELAAQGIRVVGLRPHGMPSTRVMRGSHEAKAATTGLTWEQFQAYLAGMSHTRRVMTLDELAGMAVFVASDRASAMTGTTLNLTMGGLDD
jgi:NAD(P)-dependent dehydrogenase (short-subunit alcohol dehydrogenase family)